MRIAGVGRHVLLIHEAGVEGSDQGAAVLDIKLEPIRLAPREQMQRWRKNKFVAREVFGGPRKIHRDIAIVQRVVKELNVLAEAEEFVWLHRLLQRPVVVMAVKDARV